MTPGAPLVTGLVTATALAKLTSVALKEAVPVREPDLHMGIDDHSRGPV